MFIGFATSKVFHIRNILAHFKVGQRLLLDDNTFGAFWKDITDLVDGLEGLGRQYFNQQTADELRQKINEVCCDSKSKSAIQYFNRA